MNMKAENSNKKRALRKDDIKTFRRLLGFARPYWFRLLIGAIASGLGGGSIIAMFLSAQKLLGFLLDHRGEMTKQPAIEQRVEAQETKVLPPETLAQAKAAVDGAAVQEPSATTAQAPAEPVVKSSRPTKATGFGSDYVNRMTKKYSSTLFSPEEAAQLEAAGLPRLIGFGIALMVIIIVNSLCQFLSMYYLRWVGERVVMDLRVKIFTHLQKLSISFYNSSRAGDMISRTVADTQLLQTTISHVITDAIREPLKLIMVLVFILCIEWKLAVVSVVLFPTVIIPIIMIGRKLRRISREGQKRLADLTSVMKEALDGVAVVKAFGQEEREEARFGALCRGFFRQMVRATKAKSLNDPIAHILGGLGGMAVLLYAMISKMPIEECVIFAGAIWALYEPIKKLGRISMEIQQSSGAGDRVFEILDAPITVEDAADAKPAEGVLDKIEFKDVSFDYGDKKVFEKMQLCIRAGESMAIVGPSGGGKTTLVSLLLRFFDPKSGCILRNGVDLRSLTLESIRSRIGLVLQDTFLFNASIAENIAYGAPNATREEIEAAAKAAHAHEFIITKENGYDTLVGERGSSLSGGQRQRIAIARALLRKPELLILDEATSALDTDSERAVQAAIDELMDKLTVIVIAHRLSTIAKCKHVAVLANGGVAEYGTQQELLEIPNGIYAHLHRLQFESQVAAAHAEA